jgi:hypothetical protein
MSKTTNYKISKKLAEIGFKAENWAEYVWAKDEDGDIRCETKAVIGEWWGKHKELYESYDLETLLDNLPKIIRNNEELNLKKNEIGYFFWDSDEIFSLIGEHKQKNESLADTAGRLIILLHEKNLIKF